MIDHIEVKVGDYDRSKYEDNGIMLDVYVTAGGKKFAKAIVVPYRDVDKAYEEQLKERDDIIAELIAKLPDES